MVALRNGGVEERKGDEWIVQIGWYPSCKPPASVFYSCINNKHSKHLDTVSHKGQNLF